MVYQEAALFAMTLHKLPSKLFWQRVENQPLYFGAGTLPRNIEYVKNA
jgi:hypothetical protein